MEGSEPAVEFHPLTSERWADLEHLFGPRGADGGCWCMWWRLTRAQFTAQQGDGNRTAFKALVDAGPPPGLLGYSGREAVVWVAVGPREWYPALDRSRTRKRVDDTPVWSVVCFFVARKARRHGLMEEALRAAIDWAGEHGARILEGYPYDPVGSASPWASFTGMASTFRRVGFVDVARRSERRPVMRYTMR